MPSGIRTRLVRVGNSMGLLLTREVCDLVGLEEEVDVEVQPGRLVLRPAPRPREGWAEQFQALHQGEDDPALEKWRQVSNRFDDEEWQW